MSAPAGFVNPQDSPYSAAGNGSTNDTTALQDALDDCKTNGKDLWVPRATYRFTATLTIPVGVNVECWGTLEYDGPKDRPLVIVGETNEHNDGVSINIDVHFASDGDWTETDLSALRLLNCRGCRVRARRVNSEFPEGAYAGVHFHAESGFECEGNIVELGSSFYNRFTVLADGSGDPRDNLIIGGRISVTPSGPDLDTARMKLGPNGRNTYWLYAFDEGHPPSASNACMYSEGGYNEMRYNRNEVSNQEEGWGVLAADGAGAVSNLVWTGHMQTDAYPGTGALLSGAPPGSNAVILSRRVYDSGGGDIGAIGGVQGA